MVPNTVRFRGFTTAGKLSVGIAALLLVLVIIDLPPYPMKGSDTGDRQWFPDGSRIPLWSIERMAYKKLRVWAENPVVVEAVKRANEQTATLDEIIELDSKWTRQRIAQPWQSRFLDNPCAKYLKQVQKEESGGKGLFSEIFVMDKQGRLVAATKITSDFWQGDEDKFIKAFAEGEGAVFIDEASYDRSAGIHLIQVSIPVFDPETERAIGVMTIGLNISVLAE